MLIKGIIHDFDGVVNDSFREGLRRIKVLCALMSIPFGMAQRMSLTEHWGKPGAKMLELALGISREAAEEMYRQWEVWDLQDLMPFVPGAKEVLYWEKLCGFRNAVLTTRNRQNISDIFRKQDLESRFDVICTRQDTEYLKPDPRVFRFILERFLEQFGIAKEECIFVGDTPADIEAGNSTGIETLVVQTGPYLVKHATMYPVKLENIIISLDYLPQWIFVHHDRQESLENYV